MVSSSCGLSNVLQSSYFRVCCCSAFSMRDAQFCLDYILTPAGTILLLKPKSSSVDSLLKRNTTSSSWPFQEANPSGEGSSQNKQGKHRFFLAISLTSHCSDRRAFQEVEDLGRYIGSVLKNNEETLKPIWKFIVKSWIFCVLYNLFFYVLVSDLIQKILKSKHFHGTLMEKEIIITMSGIAFYMWTRSVIIDILRRLCHLQCSLPGLFYDCRCILSVDVQ